MYFEGASQGVLMGFLVRAQRMYMIEAQTLRPTTSAIYILCALTKNLLFKND